MKAWNLLYRWYTDTSKAFMAERLMRLTQPEQCKKEEDVGYALDRWEAERCELELEQEPARFCNVIRNNSMF